MQDRNYWLDLFTGKTWEEFLGNGAKVTGFRRRRRKYAEENIKVGDYFLCYMTGIQRFIGVLEVKSEYYYDETRIWENELFPCRFNVNLIHKLEPKTAVPIQAFREKLSIFQNLKSPHAWTGVFRGSPAKFKTRDGEIIVEEIENAISKPVERDYDERLYQRTPRKFESKGTVVTVPDEQAEIDVEEPKTGVHKLGHDEIQWRLLKLGAEMGLDVWVARNDRNKQFNGVFFKDMERMRDRLPVHFDDATNRTIELIDVLWLQGDTIVAAFEVEHSSSVYSGLLRMSDLITMQPNIKINLYIAAPDERAEKVVEEINRPTFARLKQPLPKVCKFIPYSKLKTEMEAVGDRLKYMKPDFINEIAQGCEVDEA